MKTPPVPLFFPSYPDCDNRSYILVVEEEFNGDMLNEEFWEIQGWGQGALETSANQEYNTLDNLEVSDGTCKIFAKEETVLRKAVSWKPENEILSDGLPNLRTFSYTSANVWSKFQYGLGKYEMRFRVSDMVSGMWPAFWNFNANGGVWNEIDFFEIYGHNSDEWTGTVHHDIDGDGCSERCGESADGFNFTSWNTMTCEVTSDRIIWSLNNTVVRTEPRFVTSAENVVNCGDEISPQTLFQPAWWPYGESHIIFNLAISRSGDNAPNPSSIWPQTFEIDYIRYYERNACCGDMVINSNAGFNIDPDDDISNVICAQNITLTDNAILNADQNVTLIAAETITINPGATIESGSYFVTDIQESAIPCCDITIQTPLNNVFTPNGDGVNDQYCVFVEGATEYEITVYTSPWGVEFYSGSGTLTPEAEWKCLWNGNGVSDGAVYAVVVEFWNPCTPDDSPVGAGTSVHTFLGGGIAPPVDDSDSVNQSRTAAAIQERYSSRLLHSELLDSVLTSSISSSDITLNSEKILTHSATGTFDFVVYPNPASTRIEIIPNGQVTDIIEYSILNGVGQKMQSSVVGFDSSNTIPVDNLSNGLYYISLFNEDLVVTKKFLIQR